MSRESFTGRSSAHHRPGPLPVHCCYSRARYVRRARTNMHALRDTDVYGRDGWRHARRNGDRRRPLWTRQFLIRASPGDQGTWGERGLEIIPVGIAFSPTEEGAIYRFTAIHQNLGKQRRARHGALPRFRCGQRWDWRRCGRGLAPRPRAAHASLVRDVSANTRCRGAITPLPLAFSLRRFVTWP